MALPVLHSAWQSVCRLRVAARPFTCCAMLHMLHSGLTICLEGVPRTAVAAFYWGNGVRTANEACYIRRRLALVGLECSQ